MLDEVSAGVTALRNISVCESACVCMNDDVVVHA